MILGSAKGGVTLPNKNNISVAFSTAAGNGSNFDLSSLSYSENNFDVSNEENTPLTVSIKPDGTKFYVAGEQNATIYQYSMDTPFDISSGNYDEKSFDVSDETDEPAQIAFKSDGLKFAIIGKDNATIYQYSMSGAWDISTASYATKSFDVSDEENTAQGLAVSDDGTKFYVCGGQNDTIYQYSMDEWDFTTGEYAEKSLDVSDESTNPQDLRIQEDGLKIYILSVTPSDYVFQYNLGSAFDVSTGEYAEVSLNVGGQESAPLGLAISESDNKLYIVGAANDTVYEYS